MDASELAARLILPFAAGYYLADFFATMAAALTIRLAPDFSLGGVEVGLLTCGAFLAFAAVQLPLAAALDRHGPRRLQTTFLVCALLGEFLAADGASSPRLLFGLTLLGLGVSGGLMAGMKAILLRLPRERPALAHGAFIALGTAGAVAGAESARYLVGFADWRHLFALFAVLSTGTAATIRVLEART